MEKKRYKVFAISGSTRNNSTNLQLLDWIVNLAGDQFESEVYARLANLPHFNPDLDTETPPDIVAELRHKIQQADGVLICTPEYVFSLPGALKNALEWSVSTTVFSEKPVALITASGLGEKASEQLALIMKTLGARFDDQTQLLIQATRSKVTSESLDPSTKAEVVKLIDAFTQNMISTHYEHYTTD
jgi:chromate reductase